MRDLMPYAVRTLRLFGAQPDHAGLVIALAELETLLSGAADKVRRGEAMKPDVVQLARLSTDGVTGSHILAFVCAVGQYDKDHPRHFPDPRSYRFGVARAVCGLASRLSGHRRIPLGATALDALGSLLVDQYAGIAGAVASHFDKIAESQRTRGDALRQPFTTTPVPRVVTSVPATTTKGTARP